MAIIEKTTGPDIRPSLLLDFANSKSLDPRITFTRASTATYYDGKTTVKVGENLVTYSEDVGGTNWGVNYFTVTKNTTTAPDGTTTANKIDVGTSNQSHYIEQSWSGTQSGDITNSIYAKADSHDIFQIGIGNGTGYAWFDLTNGTTGALDGATSTITSVGNGWYRCTLTKTNGWNSSVNGPLISIVPSTSSNRRETFTGNNESIFVWGAQSEIRSSATAYTKTTSQRVTNYISKLVTAASGFPRFDHDPVTKESKGLLIEEQRTNLLENSKINNGSTWTKEAFSGSIQNDYGIAPDGTKTSTYINITGGYVYDRDSISNLSSGTTYTFSCYVKGPTTTSNIGLGLWSYTAGGIVATSGGGDTISTDKWTRLSVTYTPTSSTAGNFAIMVASGISNLLKEAEFWGAQVEEGDFATSYIPTSGSTVTRAADSASMTGDNFSSWYRGDEGTIYGEVEFIGGTDIKTNNRIVIALEDSTTPSTNNLIVYNRSDGIGFYGEHGNTAVNNNMNALSSSGISSVYGFHKFSMSYQIDNSTGAVDGTITGTDTECYIPYFNRLQIGRNASGIANTIIKKIAYYPARLTNDQLKDMTEE